MREITEKQLKRTLKSHKDWVDSNGKKGYRADFFETILIGVDLRGADLRRADLKGANLSWINLTDTDLRGADLRNADLSDTEVRGVDLDEADLRDARLRGADLREANLTKAILTGADLREADLRGAKLSDSVLNSTNLNDAKFFYTDHSGTNRIGADLSVALLDQTKLREVEQLKAKIEQKQIEIEKKEMEIELLKSEVLKKSSEKIKECSDSDLSPADMISPHKEKEALTQISQGEGLDRYAQALEDQKDGKIPEIRQVKNYRFAELARDYAKLAEKQRIFKTKKIWIRQLVEVFGNLDVKDFNTRMIEQWQSKQLQYNKPATVNRVLSCLKHMVNKGVQWEMADEETLERVRKVKLLEENYERPRFITVEECQTLIDCCSKHLKPIITVALHTGMRQGEILGLKWEQVDLSHGFILLNIIRNGECRKIPINNTLTIMFKNLPRGFESNYVFAGKDGDPYKSVNRSFSTALKKAGIHNFRFHDLRHTFASHLVMAGVDLTSVKELLGHKSMAMTRRYAHLSPGHKRNAINTLDNVLNSEQKQAPVHHIGKYISPYTPVAQKERAMVS